MSHPKFIYGTAWKEDRTFKCVSQALESGFLAIDTANQAKHYNEPGVGEAIAAAFSKGIKREDLFLQTKFTYERGQDNRLPYDPKAPYEKQVRQSFESSLDHLGIEYLDSYLLHGPFTGRGLAQEDWDTWGAMEDLFNSGKVKKIGVSNFSLEQMKELNEKARIKPWVVQNRCFAEMGWDKDIRLYCRENKIAYQGFSLLTANRFIPTNAQVIELSKELSATPAQLIFAFSRQIGMLPLTGTTNPTHMKEDLASIEISLSDSQLSFFETIAI